MAEEIKVVEGEMVRPFHGWELMADAPQT